MNLLVTVREKNGQFVTGLSRDDFRVYEDDALQDIQVFEKEGNVQSSLGMLVDTSGSMVDVLPSMRRGIRDFANALPRSDEFFVVSFGARAQLIHKSTESQRRLEENLELLRAFGTSRLFDSLLFSSERIRASERPRKAVIVFTDGIFTDENDGSSPYTRVIEEVQRSSVLLYFIVIGPEILVDRNTVESLSNISGGRSLYVSKNDSVLAALEQVRAELSRQYYLGYYAPRRQGLHHIRVEVPGRDVNVRTKTHYLQ